MTRRPWRLSTSEVRDFRLLEHVADAGAGWVHDLDDLGIDRDKLAVVLRDLERTGYVELEQRHNMRLSQAYPGARLTSAGTAYVETVRDSRRDTVARARACRSEVLLWLFGAGEGMPVTTRFLELGRTYFGTPFTEEDTNQAAKHLYDAGLISGVGADSWGSGGAPLGSEITTAGRVCVEEYDADPQQARLSSGSSTVYHQTINHSTGPIAQGKNATAINNQGLRTEDVQRLRETFVSGLSALARSEDREDAEQAIDDLLAELQGETVNPERVSRRLRSLERLAGRIGDAALIAAASEGGRRTLQLIANAF